VCQIYHLRAFLRPKQHRRITLKLVTRQIHSLQVQLPQRRRNLPGEAVSGECHVPEPLRDEAKRVRDGAGDAIVVEGDSVEVRERRKPGREVAGEFAVGEFEELEGFHLGQEMGYLAGDTSVSDIEFTKLGEFGDGGGYCANDVGGVGDEKKFEVGKVAYGGGNRVGFGEVNFGEVEVVDAVCWGDGVA